MFRSNKRKKFNSLKIKENQKLNEKFNNFARDNERKSFKMLNQNFSNHFDGNLLLAKKITNFRKKFQRDITDSADLLEKKENFLSFPDISKEKRRKSVDLNSLNFKIIESFSEGKLKFRKKKEKSFLIQKNFFIMKFDTMKNFHHYFPHNNALKILEDMEKKRYCNYSYL